MSLAVGSVVLRHFGQPRSSRVQCASCGRLFAAERPSPGERVRCVHCSEIVTVGPAVVRKVRTHSSRNSISSWMDEPRSATAEAMGRAAICAALVAAVVLLLSSLSGAGTGPAHAAGSHGAEDARLEDAIFNDTNGW